MSCEARCLMNKMRNQSEITTYPFFLPWYLLHNGYPPKSLLDLWVLTCDTSTAKQATPPNLHFYFRQDEGLEFGIDWLFSVFLFPVPTGVINLSAKTSSIKSLSIYKNLIIQNTTQLSNVTQTQILQKLRYSTVNVSNERRRGFKFYRTNSSIGKCQFLLPIRKE